MLSFADPRRVRENAQELVDAVGAGAADGDRAGYHEALNRIQAKPHPVSRWRPVVLFDCDDPPAAALVRHFLEIDVVEPGHVFSETSAIAATNLVAEGFDLLAQADRAGADAASFLISCFILAHKPGCGGASLGNQLGVVWLNPPSTWVVLDYADAILHETVHQALFLEEMVRRVYVHPQDVMAQDENLVVSAIRQELRPFDASLHAACVAAELSAFYAAAGIKDRADSLAAGVSLTVPGLAGRAELLTDLGRRILTELENFAAKRIPALL
jgi:hypothetical protein